MSTTQLHPGLQTTPNAFGLLIDALWSGEISEATFIKDSHQLGISIGQIEWQLEQLKAADGVQ